MPRGARADSATDSIVAAACVLAALVLLVLPPAPRDAVAGSIRRNLVGPLTMLQERASVAKRALATNDSLLIVADSVVERARRLSAVEAENARLRDLLGLGRALRWGYTPAEALAIRGLGDDHTLLLSAGAQQGVERLSAVVAADGVVGMIETVDERTSVALVWPHPEFRVSATTLDGNAYGLVSAHEGDGAEQWLLELHGVSSRATLPAGTPVVSSGLGGVFPRGVLVGTILSPLQTGRPWARSYLVRPAVRPSDITSVMVLSRERIGEDVESVWRPKAEALQRRVRAAADSVAALRARSAAAAGDSTPAPSRPEQP